MSKFIKFKEDYLIPAFRVLMNAISYFINQLPGIRANPENGINGFSIDAELESDNSEIFKLAAEVKIKQRLNNLVTINENFEDDSSYITCAEYQLFINDSQYPSPQHWHNNRFKPGNARNYVTGLIKRDATRFCTWLTGKYLLKSQLSQLKAFYKPFEENGKLRLTKVKIPSRYSQLAKYLYKHQWRKADEETSRVMLEVVGREERGYLTLEDITNFPCEDFYIINLLWVVYSQGHFGFSIQQEIYQSLKRTSNFPLMEKIVCEEYGLSVGWWSKGGVWFARDSYTFNLKNARRGHLPGLLEFGGFPRRCTVEDSRSDTLNAYIYVFSRVKNCGL
ncbi:MAG: GUN4 domain-containing protein [Cyanobacteriota bacterium]|nr:GUN4 domain-containing protein [Cyanobacteriota bacterium]